MRISDWSSDVCSSDLLWAYARDDRPWGGCDPPIVAYVYAPDRKAERPQFHLGDFAGILQVDGYGGYAALARRRQQIRLAFCWAHVRRSEARRVGKECVRTFRFRGYPSH